MALIPTLEKNEVTETVRKIYKKFEEQSGKTPEWVKVMAHSPEIVKEFTGLFNVIMTEGEVELYLKWKIGYTISDMLKCPFCVDVTSNMLKKFGATEKTIQKIKTIKNLPKRERMVIELVKDVTINANVDNLEILKYLRQKFSAAQIVEIVSVIGLFNYINRFNNTLAILPE